MKVYTTKLFLVCVCGLLIGAGNCSVSDAAEGFAATACTPVFAVLSPEEDVRSAGLDRFSLPALPDPVPAMSGTPARQNSDTLPDIGLEAPLSLVSSLSWELVERCL